MSKADTLLKKAAAFERLALYSDRKSFLQAIAQVPQIVPDGKGGWTKIEVPLGGPVPVEPPNPYENVPPPPQVEQETHPSVQTPAVDIMGYTPVPLDVQQTLKTLINPTMGVDGELGPETRKAINDFRTQYHVPGNYTDQEVFQVIRNSANR